MIYCTVQNVDPRQLVKVAFDDIIVPDGSKKMCISCHKVEPDPGSKATPRQPSKPRHPWPRPAQWGAARAQRAAGEEIFWHAFPRLLRPAAAAALGGARREAALAPKMSELPARHHYTPH